MRKSGACLGTINNQRLDLKFNNLGHFRNNILIWKAPSAPPILIISVTIHYFLVSNPSKSSFHFPCHTPTTSNTGFYAFQNFESIEIHFVRNNPLIMHYFLVSNPSKSSFHFPRTRVGHGTQLMSLVPSRPVSHGNSTFSAIDRPARPVP